MAALSAELAMSEHYQMVDTAILLVHFEKGHMVPTTRFEPAAIEPEAFAYPLRLTLLARGYASQGSIILSMRAVTWIERVRRPVWVWFDSEGDDMIAPAEEARRITIHQEHHSDIGPYACDCNVVLENPEARVEQHRWRIVS